MVLLRLCTYRGDEGTNERLRNNQLSHAIGLFYIPGAVRRHQLLRAGVKSSIPQRQAVHSSIQAHFHLYKFSTY